MGKRSRDTSFSPSGDEVASGSNTSALEPSEELRTTKLVAYDVPDMAADKHMVHCSLPPHPASVGFASLEDFEVHYAKEHTNRCLECGKNLPSDHFLTLHIDENHNPVREALAAKGEKTYACLVPDCEKKCSTPQKRRLHMIDKHNFPKVYNFRIVDYGVDNARTMLQEGRRRRVSVTNDQSSLHRRRTPSISTSTNQPAIEEDSNASPTKIIPAKSERTGTQSDTLHKSNSPPSSDAAPVDGLERSFAALHFVPRSVLPQQQGKS